MTTHVPIVKTNGTGNDFVLVDARETPLPDPAAFARRVCDHATGIGADGVLLVESAPGADARMRIINADGSEAEMCGNGIRCVARYLDELSPRDAMTIATIAGPIGARILDRAPYRIAVEMGEPRIGDPVRAAGFTGIPVDLGNPHLVVAVDDVDAVDIATVGPRIEHESQFPEGTNVHFVQRDGDGWRVRHWERGAGATQACGTGAVAVAAVLLSRGQADSPVALRVPGGVLEVEWTPGGRATLIGDAVREFARTVG